MYLYKKSIVFPSVRLYYQRFTDSFPVWTTNITDAKFFKKVESACAIADRIGLKEYFVCDERGEQVYPMKEVNK